MPVIHMRAALCSSAKAHREGKWDLKRFARSRCASDPLQNEVISDGVLMVLEELLNIHCAAGYKRDI